MNILVIKQTSLGDVLHATPHLRAIKKKYPDAHLTVLTAENSAEIYANNPYIDRLVLFDYTRFKQIGLKSPRALYTLFKQTQAEVNQHDYDLAFDLQGLLRSVVFLYFARAKRKYVKGRWLGLGGFRDKQLHAIDEMTQVLAEANIPVIDASMDFYRAPESMAKLQVTLAGHELARLIERSGQEKFLIISPFTRWASKNWPLDRFIEIARQLNKQYRVLITGVASDRAAIEQAIQATAAEDQNIVNLAGGLGLSELAELMENAGLVISGDSFPMHLATAVGTPLITLFGPTDERKTGPRSENSMVLRPGDCHRCDKPNCASACLNQISVVSVVEQAAKLLARK